MRENTAYFCGYFFMFKKLICGIFAVAGDFKTPFYTYLRKMALDGYVVKLDLPELKELVSLMRYSSNNLNQLTRKVHETGRVYDADLEDISQRQEQLWEGVQKILAQLSKLS